MARLGSTVVVYHSDDPYKPVALEAGSELPEWAEGLVDPSRLVDEGPPDEAVPTHADPDTPDPEQSEQPPLEPAKRSRKRS